jgi:hypothetical protein
MWLGDFRMIPQRSGLASHAWCAMRAHPVLTGVAGGTVGKPLGWVRHKSKEIQVIELSTLWSAAGVLTAFQVAALTLRINREIGQGDKGGLTWLPMADWLNVTSMAITLIGCFVYASIRSESRETAQTCFAAAALLLAHYPFALAGHYELFRTGSVRTGIYCPIQEAIPLSLAGLNLFVVLYLAEAGGQVPRGGVRR